MAELADLLLDFGLKVIALVDTCIGFYALGTDRIQKATVYFVMAILCLQVASQ